MKILYTTLVVMLSVSFCFAQKQGNQWYFGEFAGLDFNSGSPVPISSSSIFTNEGSASIADPTTGNLLFYTDGTSAYDATDNMMPNGYGMGGNSSTTQSAVIVPIPGSSTQYYVFTADDQADFWGDGDGGLNYNIVDMTLNGGLGDVSLLDEELLTPTAEKIEVTKACDGVNYWLVTHQWETNSFYAYLVTSSGISAPVISSVGVIYEDIGSGDNAESIGYMKISSDGSKLAVACYEDLNTVQIFDFNNGTGVVSNPITDTNYPNISGEDGPYGLCFSPDNSKLYVSYFGEYPLSTSEVFQYNLQAGNGAAIIASRVVVGEDSLSGYGALQNGPDGKMYVATEGVSSLDIIESPNALGALCDYVAGGLDISPGICSFGLPETLGNFLPGSGSIDLEPVDPYVCSGAGVVLSVDGGGSGYTWSPAAGLSSTTGDTVIANPTVTTTYTVTGTGGGGCPGTASTVVTIIPAPNIPTITTSVTGDSLVSSALNDNQWFENDTLVKYGTGQVLVITGRPKGWYKVVVTNEANGCTTTSDSTTGVTQLSAISEQLSIYPNPASSNIFVKINTAAGNINDWTMELTDVLGRTVYTKSSLTYSNEIGLSNLASGVYFISVVNKMGRAVFPVVKQ